MSASKILRFLVVLLWHIKEVASKGEFIRCVLVLPSWFIFVGLDCFDSSIILALRFVLVLSFGLLVLVIHSVQVGLSLVWRKLISAISRNWRSCHRDVCEVGDYSECISHDINTLQLWLKRFLLRVVIDDQVGAWKYSCPVTSNSGEVFSQYNVTNLAIIL